MSEGTILEASQILKTFYITYNGKISPQNTNLFINCIHSHLEKGYNHLYLLLCSEGGDVNSAFHIYNYLKEQPSLTISTHNTGVCGSAANILFLAGINRYACQYSYFWFHEINLPIQKDTTIKISQASQFSSEMRKLEDIVLNIYQSKMKIEDKDLWKYFRTETCCIPTDAVLIELIDAIKEIPAIEPYKENLGEDSIHEGLPHTVLNLE